MPNRRLDDEIGMSAITTETALGAPSAEEAGVQICLLGSFQILKRGRPIATRAGGKVELLIANLALAERQGVGRDELINVVWPGVDYDLARQSLNTLVHSLTRTLSDALAGNPLVLHPAGRYHLNVEHGVGIDVSQFDAAVTAADRLRRAGDRVGAIRAYRQATDLYGGDLAVGSAIRHLLERERLRARFLSMLARLADVSFADEDYESALDSALRLLRYDPCREDAHRLVMRCHVRLGQRAQALRQYHVCQQALASEFEASPERATEELYRLIRLDPSLV